MNAVVATFCVVLFCSHPQSNTFVFDFEDQAANFPGNWTKIPGYTNVTIINGPVEMKITRDNGDDFRIMDTTKTSFSWWPEHWEDRVLSTFWYGYGYYDPSTWMVADFNMGIRSFSVEMLDAARPGSRNKRLSVIAYSGEGGDRRSARRNHCGLVHKHQCVRSSYVLRRTEEQENNQVGLLPWRERSVPQRDVHGQHHRHGAPKVFTPVFQGPTTSAFRHSLAPTVHRCSARSETLTGID